MKKHAWALGTMVFLLATPGLADWVPKDCSSEIEPPTSREEEIANPQAASRIKALAPSASDERLISIGLNQFAVAQKLRPR